MRNGWGNLSSMVSKRTDLRKEFEQEAMGTERWKSFDPHTAIERFVQELEDSLHAWRSPEMTGIAELPPVVSIHFELSDGYCSASLLHANEVCLNGDLAGIDLDRVGLFDMAEDNERLAALGLAVGLEVAFPIAVERSAFAELPRGEQIGLWVGTHDDPSRWHVCTLKVEPYLPASSNVQRKQLRLVVERDAWAEDPHDARAAIEAFQAVDIEAESETWRAQLLSGFDFLRDQKPSPLKVVHIAWSPDAADPPLITAETSVKDFVLPVFLDLSRWLPLPSAEALADEPAHVRVRWCAEHMFAEIGCAAMWKLKDTDTFRSLRKTDDFVMFTRNRVAGAPARFYPFTLLRK